MSGLRIGELFAGYGGLGLGVQAALGGKIAWFSEFDKGPSKILDHRFPGVPNHGDITKIDWSQVEPVDILTGGSPCQDLSHAGRRAGMTEGTRSNLWVAMREAIAQLRPRLVIWENVRGAYSAAADSAVESCSGCVGDGTGEPALRALGRVLGDLSDLGYDASWHGLRAADVGAPHGRFRVFVVAYAASDAGRVEHGDGATAALAADLGHERPGRSWDGRTGSADGDSGALTLLGTPTARMWKGSGPVGSGSHTWLLDHGNVEAQVLLLPTPAVNDMDASYTPETWDEWTAKMQATHGNGNGHGKSLSIEAQRLLPTPRASDGEKGGPNQRGSSGDLMLPAAVQPERLLPTPTKGDGEGGGVKTGVTLEGLSKSTGDGGASRLRDTAGLPESDWGTYAAAIARWERTLGRPAPAPTMTSAKGNPQLSPAFVEWMMGLPAGWVTDVPGITRNEALKALGNGVCPQQAAAAIREMLSWEVAA